MSDTSGRPQQPTGSVKQPTDRGLPAAADDDTEGHGVGRQFPSPPSVRLGRGGFVRGDGTPADLVDDGEDTEGHRIRPDGALPSGGRIGPGEKLLRGDGTPADFLDDRDTEGHLQFGRRAGGGE